MSRPSFLFCPGGGIGDAIISLPVLDFVLHHIAPHADLDTLIGFPKEIYKDILGSRFNKFRHVHERELPQGQDKYQGSLSANELCHVQMSNSLATLLRDKNPGCMRLLELGSGRMMTAFGEAAMAPLGSQHFNHHAVSNKAVEMGLDRYSLPIWSLGLNAPYPTPKLPYPVQIAEPINTTLALPYITINDGWAGDSAGRLTKSWHSEGWKELVRLCRASGIRVVQIGSQANGQSYDVDVQLRGQLSFASSLAVLRASCCHVDIEGGLVHAAAALCTPSVVLFGPTPVDFFGYTQNINLTHSHCQNCWWTTADWMKNCPRAAHICMLHQPQAVFEAVQSIIKGEQNGND